MFYRTDSNLTLDTDKPKSEPGTLAKKGGARVRPEGSDKENKSSDEKTVYNSVENPTSRSGSAENAPKVSRGEKAAKNRKNRQVVEPALWQGSAQGEKSRDRRGENRKKASRENRQDGEGGKAAGRDGSNPPTLKPAEAAKSQTNKLSENGQNRQKRKSNRPRPSKIRPNNIPPAHDIPNDPNAYYNGLVFEKNEFLRVPL